MPKSTTVRSPPRLAPRPESAPDRHPADDSALLHPPFRIQRLARGVETVLRPERLARLDMGSTRGPAAHRRRSRRAPARTGCSSGRHHVCSAEILDLLGRTARPVVRIDGNALDTARRPLLPEASSRRGHTTAGAKPLVPRRERAASGESTRGRDETALCSAHAPGGPPPSRRCLVAHAASDSVPAPLRTRDRPGGVGGVRGGPRSTFPD